MNRQNIIFVSLLLIAATAIVAVGYATGRGPLAVISGGVSQITSGGQMIPSRSVTEETKGLPAPEISSVNGSIPNRLLSWACMVASY